MKLKKRIRDEKTKLDYSLQGDYYLPDLELPEKEERVIGKFGRMHERYLKENKRAVYYNMLSDGILEEYLADVDEQAQEMFEAIVNQTKEQRGITEEFKANDPMAWIQEMNSIVDMAEEFVKQELIYL